MLWGFPIPREDVEQAFALFCATFSKTPDQGKDLPLEFAAWLHTNAGELDRQATLRRIHEARSANAVEYLRT